MGLKRAFSVFLAASTAALPGLVQAQAAPAPVATAAPRTVEIPSPAASAADARLIRIFSEDARREDDLDPLNALYRGEEPDPKSLAQLFTDALDRKLLASGRRSLADLAQVDRAQLTPEKQISYDIFARDKREQVAWLQPDIRALTTVRPFNHFGGIHVEFPSIVARDGLISYDDEGDYRRALLLDGAMVAALDNAILRFRQGMKSGVVEPKLTVRNMIAQIDAIVAQPPEASPFYSPVVAFPDAVPEAHRAGLRTAFADVIRERIYPVYRRLRTFLNDEYLPAARDSVGLAQMKGGTDLYGMLIEKQTTLKMAPDEVHKLGLSEVARIQAEMEGVKRELGYTGPLKDFFEFIRTDPKYHPRTREELAAGFAAVARKVDQLAPSYFSKMPRTPLIIQSYPAYREKYEAGGSYNQGSADGKRPGVFYFNAYDLPSRFLTGITTLYLHEGAPGHHFQISLAQENESLPSFQRFDGNTAYVEGWALYAETLGYDMGFYKDPMQHWGTLDDEMLRAMRLVVDTGLHTKSWSRDQAIDYMLANSGMGRTDATAEVERYIANPGQALAYKIGALMIQTLRKRSESGLGRKFDIRAFHDQVLGSGALPLPILEAKINRWIASQQQPDASRMEMAPVDMPKPVPPR